jgi:hypothetical protein
MDNDQRSITLAVVMTKSIEPGRETRLIEEIKLRRSAG